MIKRFYEVENPEELAGVCRDLWCLPSNVYIGPVNTNYSADSTQEIRLVVICESPSHDEIIKGCPTVGITGTRIYNRYKDSNPSKCLKERKDMEFKEWYSCFENNGIYITNLVRCQADFGVAEPNVKNERVKLAWPLNRKYLKEEIDRVVQEGHKPSVLFACGCEFDFQVKQAIEDIRGLGLSWMVSYHPSRLPKKLAWHYNPDCWGDKKSSCPGKGGGKR